MDCKNSGRASTLSSRSELPPEAGFGLIDAFEELELVPGFEGFAAINGFASGILTVVKGLLTRAGLLTTGGGLLAEEITVAGLAVVTAFAGTTEALILLGACRPTDRGAGAMLTVFTTGLGAVTAALTVEAGFFGSSSIKKSGPSDLRNAKTPPPPEGFTGSGLVQIRLVEVRPKPILPLYPFALAQHNTKTTTTIIVGLTVMIVTTVVCLF